MFGNKLNKRKSAFFEIFYHLKTYEGHKDLEQVAKIAAEKSNLSLDSVLDALQEIENRNRIALINTNDSAVFDWFIRNSGSLAKIIRQNNDIQYSSN